jgi:hypothetical protein
MRRIAGLLTFLALAGCTSDIDVARPTDTVGDIASYDAIRQATQACNAGGGQLERRSQASGERASDYVCRRAPQGGH